MKIDFKTIVEDVLYAVAVTAGVMAVVGLTLKILIHIL